MPGTGVLWLGEAAQDGLLGPHATPVGGTQGKMPPSTTAREHHVTRMQQIVLQWDYFKLTQPSKTDRPRKLTRVPEHFENSQAQDEFSSIPHPAVVFHFEKTHDFHFAQLGVEAGRNRLYAENDVVVLSQAKPRSKDAKNRAYALASVESQEGSNSIRVRFFLPDNPMLDDAERASLHHDKAAAHARAMRNKLQEINSAWWLTRLCNMSTIMREWLGLHNAPTFPFSDVIIRPHVRVDHTITCRSCPEALLNQLRATHNSSQLKAITTALEQHPVNLIQGPPGTGKTRTILGLLSVLLQSTPVITGGNNTKVVTRNSASLFRPSMMEADKKKHWRTGSPWLMGGAARELSPLDPIHSKTDNTTVWQDPASPVLLHKKNNTKLHVLVCAPSNSALDEIVYRIIHSGLTDDQGETYIPSIVRVGVNPHHSIQSVSMEHQMRMRMETTERASRSCGSRTKGNDRDRMRISILDESSIVCSTLAFSGSSMFSRMTRSFDVVVIDEAAQAVEPSTMVPLGHGCRQLFLVGDPIQLPATVLSDRAKDHGYDDSLFYRLQSAGYPVNMLTVQYRMHPSIRMFPSLEFYDETLEDGPNVHSDNKRIWHEKPCFGPFAWLDVRGCEFTPEGSGSKANKDEALCALAVLKNLMLNYPELREPGLIAIISPYKEQVRLVRGLLLDHLGEEIAKGIDVNTIDGFQGREKLVAIFSGVRSDEKTGIGFVRDQRRMNVGLTRGRASMLVIGNARVLRKSAPWRRLVRSAKERRCMFKLAAPFERDLARLTAKSYDPGSEQYSDEEDSEEWEDNDSDDQAGADEDLVNEQRGAVGVEDEEDDGGNESGNVSVGSKRSATEVVVNRQSRSSRSQTAEPKTAKKAKTT